MNKKRILLVISHTQHYLLKDGTVVGWSSTVREMEELAKIFSKIIHIACLYPGEPTSGLSAYKNKQIVFVPIPPYGGKGLKKLSVIFTIPVIILTVLKQLRIASDFQFRAPTSMGVYLIPLLSLWLTKKGWFKYAGNWAQTSPPLSYGFQRFCLTHLQKRKVTINGHWPNQPTHCITFENPCLEYAEIEEGSEFVKQKQYIGPFKICFVGRLESEKGVGRILESLRNLDNSSLIHSVHFIGDGPEAKKFKLLTEQLAVKCIFHGFLSREQTFAIMKDSHFLLFPTTASEGFPKVIAEAWNWGCIPIVTNISSIAQYVVDNDNGFLLDWKLLSEEYLNARLKEIFKKGLNGIASNGQKVAQQFTYERYIENLQSKILFVER